MTTTHEVKCWPEHFRQLQNAERTFDVRENDRDYQDGDLIVQQEFEPLELHEVDEPPEAHPSGRYTGSTLKYRINRVFRDHPGVNPGHAVLALGAVMER